MARVIWTQPAVADLLEIAEYIELDKPEAARRFVGRVFATVEKLETFPKLGRVPAELKDFSYRELVIPPCRIFYRIEKKSVFIVAVMRMEREVLSFSG